MNFTTNNNGRGFRSPEGYVIRRDGSGNCTPYWKAYDPEGRELAGGAGDNGWRKCVELCEQHQRHSKIADGARDVVRTHFAAAAQPPERVAPSPNQSSQSCESRDPSPQQSSLL